MSLSTLIIIFASDIILGLISIALAKYKIRKDKIYIDTFVENVIGLMNPKASKKAKHGNTDYVLRNYQEASRIKFNGEIDREIDQLNKQRFNPFNLLYRGVELVMNFVFGYFISKVNTEFDHEQNKAWRTINSIITIVGSLASILSYLHQILQWVHLQS